MKQDYKIALIQANFSVLEVQSNLQKALMLCGQAAENGAKLICLPEAFLQGYNNDKMAEMVELAVTLEDDSVKAMRNFAKEHGVYVVAPMLVKTGDGVENTAIFIGEDGEIIGTYAKVDLTRFEAPHMKHGEAFPVWDTPLGRIGLLICLDMCYPEPAGLLGQQQADLIIIPAAWRDVSNFADTWDRYLPVRAIDSGAYVAGINYCGSTGDTWFSGGSQVCSSMGDPIATCGRREEAILYCELTQKGFESDRKSAGIISSRHPERYTLKYTT